MITGYGASPARAYAAMQMPDRLTGFEHVPPRDCGPRFDTPPE